VQRFDLHIFCYKVAESKPNVALVINDSFFHIGLCLNLDGKKNSRVASMEFLNNRSNQIRRE